MYSCPEIGGPKFVEIIAKFLADYTRSHPRKPLFPLTTLVTSNFITFTKFALKNLTLAIFTYRTILAHSWKKCRAWGVRIGIGLIWLSTGFKGWLLRKR
jgi:hypothetical protein